MIQKFIFGRPEDPGLLEPVIGKIHVDESGSGFIRCFSHQHCKIGTDRIRTDLKELSRLDVATEPDDQLGVTLKGSSIDT